MSADRPSLLPRAELRDDGAGVPSGPVETSTKQPPQRLGLHLLLFGLTLLTTTATGAMFVHGGAVWPLTDGLAFSLPLMAILVCHEFGHYFAARWHGVPASLPFFIPLPPGIGLFGTMGAVITQAGTRDRRKLIDIGAAGPLAGLVVAIPVLTYGLVHSRVGALQGIGMQEGNSLLYALLKHATKGAWLPSDGQDVMLHPTAWAGWAGLLVTMLNLLPIGQLDGGHVATAYFGNRYARAAQLVHKALPWLALAAFGWVLRAVTHEAGGRSLPDDNTPLSIALNASLAWFVWFAMLWILGRLTGGLDHPPIDDETPLPRGRKALFWVVALAFVAIFMPVPLRLSVGVDRPPPTAERPVTAPPSSGASSVPPGPASPSGAAR